MVPARFSTQIIAKKMLNAYVLEVRFAKPEGFTYQAGQFLQLLVPGENTETPRSYSLSSTPTDDYLEFGIKLYETGLTLPYITKTNIGEEVMLRGPFGRFINTYTDPIVGIATGVGLVPILGIARDELLNKKNTAPIKIIFGVRTEADLFWLEELQTLANNFANFTFEVTLSQPSETWTKLRGRVTEHLTHTDSLTRYFICGSPEMVKDVKTKLTGLGAAASQLHFEIF